MAFRLVYGNFWTDPRVMEKMTPEDKFFYLYILTNPSTTSCGIYMITKKQMAFEMGYSIEVVNTLMDRFETQYKLIAYNKETWELAIKNWGKYNLSRGGKPVIDCLTAELGRVKDKTLIKYVQERIKNQGISDLYKSFLDSSTDRERHLIPQGDNTYTNTDTYTSTNTEREINTNTDININTKRDTSIRINTSENRNMSEGINADTYAKEEEAHNLSLSLIQEYEKLTGHIGVLKLAAVKVAIMNHGYSNVKKAINKALEKGKLSMSYTNGILRTWATEGYPKEGETNCNRSTYKNDGCGKNEFAGFKPPESRTLTEEERKELEGELI